MKKINKIIILGLVLVVIFSLSACTKSEKNDLGDKEEAVTSIDDKTSDDEDKKEISSKRVVNLSPPVLSLLLTFPEEPNYIVGVNPRTFNTSNPDILDFIYPQYKDIDSSFVNNDFTINLESLLNLKPELILYYGKFEAKGLEKVDIPMINMKIDSMDPKVLTIEWEEILSDALGVENAKKMKNSWDRTDEILKDRNSNSNTPLKGLYIFSNMKGVKVSGKNSYGDSFLNMVGIENVAAEAEGFSEGAGQLEVSMEQINQWDPDIIFIATGRRAEEVIDGSIPNQDWSTLAAVNEKKVYNIPSGTYSWGMPSADSPLMPLWLLNRIDESLFSESELKQEIWRHYKDVYGVELSDELINSILVNNHGK